MLKWVSFPRSPYRYSYRYPLVYCPVPPSVQSSNLQSLILQEIIFDHKSEVFLLYHLHVIDTCKLFQPYTKPQIKTRIPWCLEICKDLLQRKPRHDYRPEIPSPSKCSPDNNQSETSSNMTSVGLITFRTGSTSASLMELGSENATVKVGRHHGWPRDVPTYPGVWWIMFMRYRFSNHSGSKSWRELIFTSCCSSAGVNLRTQWRYFEFGVRLCTRSNRFSYHSVPPSNRSSAHLTQSQCTNPQSTHPSAISTDPSRSTDAFVSCTSWWWAVDCQRRGHNEVLKGRHQGEAPFHSYALLTTTNPRRRPIWHR